MLNFKDIAKIFEKVELQLMASLKRNLHKHKSEEEKYGFNWSAWQAEKLKNMEQFRRENTKIVGKYSPVIDEETHELMSEQFAEGEKNVDEIVNTDDDYLDNTVSTAGADKSLLTNEQRDFAQPTGWFGVNEEKMNALMTDITEIEKKCETAAVRMTDDIYRTVVNRVQLSMATGSMTLTQAIDDAVKEFLERGINCIQYADGKRVNVADYVRMALRTTSTRATLQGEAKRRSELGYDTVMTSQYGGCSETCEPWQGRVYIDDVFTVWTGEKDGDNGISNYCGKTFPLLSTAIRAGLFHPNCRHTLLTYIDGVTQIPKPIDADKIKKQRELEQKQRAMERKIRKLKRLCAGTENPDTAKVYRKQLRQAQGELKAFVDENDKVLKRDYSREKQYGGLTENKKNVMVYGGFDTATEIDNSTKIEILNSIEKLQLQYDIRPDKIVYEEIKNSGKVAFQFQPVNENGVFKSKFVINSGFNWEENLDKMNERIYNKNYKRGILSSKNVEDLVSHDMAHIMSFQDCNTYFDFEQREREIRQSFVAGVSDYSDMSNDGNETLAEGFVRIKNGETVDEQVRNLVNYYVERWKK